MYEQFFEEEKAGIPYSSDNEAVDDIRALVDMYLNMAFYNRDVEGERLDMRGVVITPQEFGRALTDWTIKARFDLPAEEAGYREAVKREAARGKEHIDSRIQQEPPRIHWLTNILSLDWMERFCFYLALAGGFCRKYERIFGYIQDNVSARQPTLGLALSLFHAGEGDDLDCKMKSSSPLWKFILSDTRPAEGESRLSRPLAVRECVYRYLEEEELIWGWWSGFACLTGSGEEGGRRLNISLSALAEALELRDSGERPAMWETVTTLAFIGLVENAEFVFTGSAGIQGHKGGEQLLCCLEQAGIKPPELNVLGPCASRVRSVYGWEDLILEDSQKELMRRICNMVRFRDPVRAWGFGGGAYGNGISAVFYGVPGTGKTMAAQVLGTELGLDTYKIDLSQLMSKYIGETEKNLNQLFARAREHSSILFFDEADGLFARRSSVESSNDRYANMETGYLLQKFEEYDGIVILATNYINNIDDAFKRRIKFFVRFTFPDQNMRLKLWTSMLPEQARVDEPLRLEHWAARFELSGSDIRSVFTSAAYLAASEHRGLCNQDIAMAIQAHYLKLGRKLGKEEFI